MKVSGEPTSLPVGAQVSVELEYAGICLDVRYAGGGLGVGERKRKSGPKARSRGGRSLKVTTMTALKFIPVPDATNTHSLHS